MNLEYWSETEQPVGDPRKFNPDEGWRQLAWIAVLGAIFAAAVAILSAQPASAQSTSEPSATVRIQAWDCGKRGCGIVKGSGTLIGKSAPTELAVLTCAHIVPETILPDKPLKVEIVPGDWREARVVRFDRAVDLGLLAVPFDREVETIQVSQSLPTATDLLVSRGFPRGGAMRSARCRLIGHNTDQTLWTCEGAFIDGESGGSVIGPGGVVGVIVATDVVCLGWNKSAGAPAFVAPERGYAVTLTAVRKFVADFVPDQFNPQANPKKAPQLAQANRQPVDVMAPDSRAQLGEPAPINPPADNSKPVDNPKPFKRDAELKPVVVPEPESIEWTGAKLLILVPKRPSLDKLDVIVRKIEELSAGELGPGQVVRRKFNEWTGAKADIEVIYQRIEPKRYAAIVRATGVEVGGYAMLLALIEKGKDRLLGPLKAFAARMAEERMRAMADKIPVDWVLERTNPDEYDAAVLALKVREDGDSDGGSVVTTSKPGATADNSNETRTQGILATIFAALAGIRTWIQGKRGG